MKKYFLSLLPLSYPSPDKERRLNKAASFLRGALKPPVKG
jgi:hypothetical protein